MSDSTTPRTRRVCLIVNPSAGGGRAARRLPEAESALRELGIQVRAERTRSLQHAAELAADAAADGEVVVTLGGDGLVGRVAGVVADCDGLLGVLPGGRGNDFARTLGIPKDASQACRVIATGTERRLDLGEVDGSPFIGIASCGFDSDANRIANEAPAFLGNLVYAYGALRALLAWKPAHFELRLDGDEHSFSGWSVAAANSKAYGGGMFLAPDAELDDGALDVVISHRSSKRRFLRSLPKTFKGTHVLEPEVDVRRASEVHIAADRPFAVYADGDPIADLPATVRIRPGAVRVLAPS